MQKINISSFHEYDVRGVYPTEIDENLYYHLGKGMALYITNGPIAVGHDARTSSPSLSQSFIKGVTDYGVDVVDLGQISTEMHYFASGKYKYPANVMITASHNPKEYNGAKIVKAGVVPIYGHYGLPEIKKLVLSDVPKPGTVGKVKKRNIFNEWVEHVLSFVDVDLIRGLKVVVDAGNGMGGPIWKELSKRLSIEVIPLYLDPNGSFPNHLPDPLKPENIQDIIKSVKEHSADMGIALDGDADRAFFIDENGTALSGTITTALLARHFLKKRKGVYFYNAICGRIVPETIEKYGSRAIRTPVGHAGIKERMRKHNGVFAGEHSGHYYFGDNFYAESSAIAGLLMMSIIIESGKNLSSLRAQFDKYPQSGEINFKVNDRNEVMRAVKNEYEKKAKIDELDGLSVWMDNYWFSVRASNTEPVLRLNIEADNSEILEKVKSEVIGFLELHGAKRK